MADGVNKENNFCVYVQNKFINSKNVGLWFLNIHPTTGNSMRLSPGERELHTLALQYGADKILFSSTPYSKKHSKKQGEINNSLSFFDIDLANLKCTTSFHTDTQYAFTKLCWLTGTTAIGLTDTGRICTINVDAPRSTIMVDAPKIIKTDWEKCCRFTE